MKRWTVACYWWQSEYLLPERKEWAIYDWREGAIVGYWPDLGQDARDVLRQWETGS